MLHISFQGWVQYRAALDPDPTDEPRGRSGPTFALPGEPDFDTFIRLQGAVAPRYPHQHDHGVFVSGVDLDGNPLAAHPLLGAAVDLLPVGGRHPTYEERGYIVTYQKVPIDPFWLQIRGGGVTIDRTDYWDPARPGLTILEVSKQSPELIPRRQPQVAAQSPLVAEATGIMDYVQYRRDRRADLARMLERATDPIERAALKKRIDDLKKDEDTGMTGLLLANQQFLGLIATYQFDMNGVPAVDDPQGRLGGVVGTSQPWPLTFWMGGYDCDSLFCYMRGTLSLPFFPRPAP